MIRGSIVGWVFASELKLSLATSWVSPLVAPSSNFVCASLLARKLIYLPARGGR